MAAQTVREIDGFEVWAGAVRWGEDPWYPTIGLRRGDEHDMHRAHVLHSTPLASSSEAMDHAADRIAAITAIGPNGELIF